MIQSFYLEKKLAELSKLRTERDRLELKICDTLPEDLSAIDDEISEKLSALEYELNMIVFKIAKVTEEIDRALSGKIVEESQCKLIEVSWKRSSVLGEYLKSER